MRTPLKKISPVSSTVTLLVCVTVYVRPHLGTCTIPKNQAIDNQGTATFFTSTKEANMQNMKKLFLVLFLVNCTFVSSQDVINEAEDKAEGRRVRMPFSLAPAFCDTFMHHPWDASLLTPISP